MHIYSASKWQQLFVPRACKLIWKINIIININIIVLILCMILLLDSIAICMNYIATIDDIYNLNVKIYRT